MQRFSIKDLNERYDLELDKIVGIVKKKKPKRVLLQFPDGLKPYALVIKDYLNEWAKGVEFLIWFGSCYGACDFPINLKDIDLILQFGHNGLMPSY